MGKKGWYSSSSLSTDTPLLVPVTDVCCCTWDKPRFSKQKQDDSGLASFLAFCGNSFPQ